MKSIGFGVISLLSILLVGACDTGVSFDLNGGDASFGSLSGIVYETGTHRPLGDVDVSAGLRKTTTQSSSLIGFYILTLKLGDNLVTAELQGYLRYSEVVDLGLGSTTHDIYLTPSE